MHHRCIGTILCQIVSGTIVKADTNSKNDIGIVHRHIGFIGAVHPQHPQALWV